MKIEVAYLLPGNQGCYLSVVVPDNFTIIQVLNYINFFSLYPEIDLLKNKVGVFGKQVASNYRLTEGDRLEIYRPIYVDVKLTRLETVKVNIKTKMIR